jgi:hypothetical protein
MTNDQINENWTKIHANVKMLETEKCKLVAEYNRLAVAENKLFNDVVSKQLAITPQEHNSMYHKLMNDMKALHFDIEKKDSEIITAYTQENIEFCKNIEAGYKLMDAKWEMR